MVKVIVSDAAEQDEKLTKIQKKAVIADTPKQTLTRKEELRNREKGEPTPEATRRLDHNRTKVNIAKLTLFLILTIWYVQENCT